MLLLTEENNSPLDSFPPGSRRPRHSAAVGEMWGGGRRLPPRCSSIQIRALQALTSEALRPRRAMATTKDRSLLETGRRLATCVICGAAFGLAMEKGRVFEPLVIRGQMNMSNFIMLKVFLSAVASGGICLLALSLHPATCRCLAIIRQAHMDSLLISKGLLTSVIGGALLGCGITLSGACPGMVLIQVGTGVPGALLTTLGCLGGALLYGLAAAWITEITRPARPFQHPTVDSCLGMSYVPCTVLLCGILALAVAALEAIVPWQSEVAPSQLRTSDVGMLWRTAWPPYLAGGIIGALQVPMVLGVEHTIGGSSSYCAVVSRLLANPPSYLAKYRHFCWDSWWQVMFAASAVVGGALSAYLSGSSQLHPVAGVAPLHALLGGVLLVFGARLAGGCTSGHGLSGMALLSTHAFITVPSMFFGAMVTSWLLF